MREGTLFEEFEFVSSKQWRQKIQAELKGADYNQTLVWESPEGIKVKPFYHEDEFEAAIDVQTEVTNFKILQRIFVHDLNKSNAQALQKLERGAEAVMFVIEDVQIDISNLFKGLPNTATYYIKPLFFDVQFVKKIEAFSQDNQYTIRILIDPINQLERNGNWYKDIDADFIQLNKLESVMIPYLSVDLSLYQNAGSTIVQQLAYTLAHLNEYFNRIKFAPKDITFQVSVGGHYFFEIAKLRALRLLFAVLQKEYGYEVDCHIVAEPTKRNKTLYDYNVNMLRTTTECMSAILGGADAVSNLAYDVLFHKDNEFGDRIARNQLLILKHESYFDKVNNPADGSYYIETITRQLAEKALALFKDIEASGGLVTQLIAGTIQRKIGESANKEQELFDQGKEVLIGTNKYPNKEDRMKHDLELYPFVKKNPRKTLIVPIIEKRLAEKYEQDRLATES